MNEIDRIETEFMKKKVDQDRVMMSATDISKLFIALREKDFEIERLKGQMIQAARESAGIVDLAAENVRLQQENDKLHCHDCAVQAFEVACVLQDYKDKNEAQQQEIERLEKCYKVTNDSWKQLKDQNSAMQEVLAKAEDALRDISNYLYDLMPVGELSCEESDLVWKLNSGKEMADKALEVIDKAEAGRNEQST